MANRTLPGLTGLRGIAAVWVVAYHLYGVGPQAHGPIALGYLGVDIFFILSGFVLSHVYAAKFERFSWRNYTEFLHARVARIYPLHLFVLCILGIIVLTLPGFAERYSHPELRWGAVAFVEQLLLIHMWIPFADSSVWNTTSWTLSAEWFAYMAFPLFVMATQRYRSIATPLIMALAVIVFFESVPVVERLLISQVRVPGTLKMACEFACGCFLFRASANGFRTQPVAAELLVCALLFLSLFVHAAQFLALPAFAATVLLSTQDKGLVAQTFSTKPMVFLGEISYSIYLVHWIVIQIFHWWGDQAPQLWLAHNRLVIAATILPISVLTYRNVERPARAWARKSLTWRPARLLDQLSPPRPAMAEVGTPVEAAKQNSSLI